VGSESAFYLIQGTVETRYGERLEQRVVNRAGDFLFIPPGIPHQPINPSATEPAWPATIPRSRSMWNCWLRRSLLPADPASAVREAVAAWHGGASFQIWQES
jgi:uncharacterized RmlC-like cupin family protein